MIPYSHSEGHEDENRVSAESASSNYIGDILTALISLAVEQSFASVRTHQKSQNPEGDGPIVHVPDMSSRRFELGQKSIMSKQTSKAQEFETAMAVTQLTSCAINPVFPALICESRPAEDSSDATSSRMNDKESSRQYETISEGLDDSKNQSSMIKDIHAKTFTCTKETFAKKIQVRTHGFVNNTRTPLHMAPETLQSPSLNPSTTRRNTTIGIRKEAAFIQKRMTGRSPALSQKWDTNITVREKSTARVKPLNILTNAETGTEALHEGTQDIRKVQEESNNSKLSMQEGQEMLLVKPKCPDQGCQTSRTPEYCFSQSKHGSIVETLQHLARLMHANSAKDEFNTDLYEVFDQVQSIMQNIKDQRDKCYKAHADTKAPEKPRDDSTVFRARVKTQERMLEAEIESGQDRILKLKLQHEKELQKLEKELTLNRVARIEAEKSHSDVCLELRLCRQEVASYVADAVCAKRYKNQLEKQLLCCNNKLQFGDIVIEKLKVKVNTMKKLVARTQMQIEKYRQSDLQNGNELPEDNMQKSISTAAKQVTDCKRSSKMTEEAAPTNSQKDPINSENCQNAADEEELRKLQAEVVQSEEKLRQAIQQSQSKLDELFNTRAESYMGETIALSSYPLAEKITSIDSAADNFSIAVENETRDVLMIPLETDSLDMAISNQTSELYQRWSKQRYEMQQNKFLTAKPRYLKHSVPVQNNSKSKAQESMLEFQRVLSQATSLVHSREFSSIGHSSA